MPLGFKSALKSIGKSLGIAISFSSSDLKAIYSPEKLTFLKDGTEFTTTLFHRYINLSSDLDDLFDTNEIDAHGRPVITDLKTDTGFSEELIKWVSFISPQSLPSPRFVLTHDVDIPNKNDFLRSFKFIPKNAQLKDLFKYYSSFILKLGRIALNPKNDFWNFQEIIDLEHQYNFKSCFLFTSIQKNTAYSHPLYDVDYSLNASEMQNTFSVLHSQNIEIGLHGSYNVQEKRNKYREEFNLLAEATNKATLVHRNHFYRFGTIPSKAIKAYSEAGIKLDCSLKSSHKNDCPLGIYHPYQLKGKDGFLSCWELPTLLMDSHFFEDQTTYSEKLEEAKKYIDKVIQLRGTVAINWHVRTSISKDNTFKEWGKLYADILNYLSEKHVDVITPSELIKQLAD